MHRSNLLKRFLLYCLILILIYPLSPIAFKKVLSIKEPGFISPLPASDKILIRSDFMGDGHFRARRSGGKRRHKGLDMVSDVGEAVVASKSGVVKTGEVPKGMGKYVKISHFEGYTTVYGHLDSICIKDKAWVWQGKKIGEVGKTGNANFRRMKAHLHFEIRKDKIAQDPLPHLIKEVEAK